MKCYIRLATIDDAKAVANIHAESWTFAYGNIISSSTIAEYNSRRLKMWTNILANNKNWHYTIVVDNKVIGFFSIAVSRDEDLKRDHYEIVSIYFSPQYVGLGYGKQAINWIKKEVQKRGYRSISVWVLECNVSAIKFYEAVGFMPDGKIKPSGLDSTREVRYALNLFVE